MASPVNTFKTNLFDQLKSYGDVVQDVFEQRIARPLLALKRDLSRSSSTARPTTTTTHEQESIPQTTFITHEETLSASTPLEIIDIETNNSLKTIIDRVKSTFSPTTKRRSSDIVIDDDNNKPKREQRHSSISSLSNKTHRKNRLRTYKSVSFAENIQYNPNDTRPSDDNQQEIFHLSTDENPIEKSEKNDDDDDDDDNFEQNFYQIIKPRRLSIGNGKDLVYQDLSAEIVAYVLKHAIKSIEKEDEEFLLERKEKLNKTNNDDAIDLK